MPVLQRAATVSGRRGLNIFSPSRTRFPAGGHRDGRPGATAISRPRVQALCWWIEKLEDPFNDRDFFFAAGPAADERTRCRYAIFDTTVEIQRSGKRALP